MLSRAPGSVAFPRRSARPWQLQGTETVRVAWNEPLSLRPRIDTALAVPWGLVIRTWVRGTFARTVGCNLCSLRTGMVQIQPGHERVVALEPAGGSVDKRRDLGARWVSRVLSRVAMDRARVRSLSSRIGSGGANEAVSNPCAAS